MKFNLRFNNCRLLEYAASIQYILYEMNSDQIIFSCDIIFDESFKFYSSNWIFDFDLSDKLLLSICFYTQKSLFSETNIKSFSASHIIDCVEASMMKSSASLLVKSSVKSVKTLVKLSQPAQQLDKQWVKSQDRFQIKSTSKSTNEFSMSSADTEFNEMMNFLHSNISDEMFFSNYNQKRMSFRLLQNVKKSTWLTAMHTSCNANHQLRVLVMSKFEHKLKFYKEAMKFINQIQWKIMMKNEYQSLIENKIWIQIKWSDVLSDHQVLNRK